MTRGDAAISCAITALLAADILVGLWGGGSQPGVAGWYVVAVGTAWAVYRLVSRRRGGGRAAKEGREEVNNEQRYEKALAAVAEEVDKIVVYDETPPEVQCVLDVIAAICEHRADVRTEADKRWRPETAHEVGDADAIDDTGKPPA